MKMECSICGNEQNDDWTCNAAVLGDYIEIKGHKQCIEAVNEFVVIPNRIRLIQR